MTNNIPTLYLGTGIFGTSPVDTVEAVELALDAAERLGIKHIDTAGRYPATNIGESQRLLAKANAAARGFIIDTKVLYPNDGDKGSGSLQKVRDSMATSLEVFGVEKINNYYFHGPDFQTPLEEQASAMDELYRKGQCKAIGLSNFPPAMLKDYISICESKGYVKPSVLQIPYSLIDRSIESSLLPLIHKHNMHIVAYSPLAGGFLTGKLTAETAGGPPAEHTLLRQLGLPRMDKPHLHEAVRTLQTLIEPHKIGTAEAALRWLAYHSALGEHDAILLGMSRVEQLEQNVADIRKGPLPDDVVKGCDEIWATLGKSG